jgi:putative SOS response-associated peptidase YedK
MCNRYHPSRADEFYAEFKAEPPTNFPPGQVFPRSRGVFLRRAKDHAAFQREAVVGQWGLIPWFAKTAALPYSTNNARIEGVTNTASFKQPWAKGQRCIIPAAVYWEPNWESGKNQWWRFKRADRRPWALAGLWSSWTDKPDPKSGPTEQDKRSVVVLEAEDYDTWLAGTQDEARELVKLAPVEVFDAAPDLEPREH